ncbi:DUF6777 domain-containing protein [Streptomyces sp. NPDC006335]|uniref:DUF6777 domain-containing protein n=1 Tax=Streptomyces sp. NPDC006335 TaxID=3156895 RepID=UPI0033B51C73
MRTPTRTLVTACVLTAALLVAGCGRDENIGEADGALLLQPAAAQGPDPFTRSAATVPPPLTRTPQRDPAAPRTVSGGTPGLYGGTERIGSCDVERQIDDLTADRSRVSAFARVAGVSPAAVPDHLRALAPVVLRADTRVTDHGYRGGRARAFQSVLQAGTAVLVDDRGVPRVRCACGNPLTPPVAMPDGTVVSGRPWPGYRPDQAVVVAPSEQVVTDITIIDLVDHSWIERRIHHDCRHDHVVPPPEPQLPPPTVPPSDSASPDPSFGADPPRPAPDCPTEQPYDENCPAPTAPPAPPEAPPHESRTTAPAAPANPDAEIGPDTVPDTPDLPDGGGLIPDDPDADPVLDSSTDASGA